MQDLVYRWNPAAPRADVDAHFHWVGNPWQLLPRLPLLRRRFGWRALLRLAAVTATPSRAFFFIEHAGLPASHGRVAFGHCRHYPVEGHAAVLGEIWSDPAVRGQGLATRAINGAINRLSAHGVRTLYIDTQVGNAPMRRVIERCGFDEVGRAAA
ncbi:MAG TPA: GNAT family N-acetyltransferase [Gammaproteobacteria bacterium]